MTSKLLDKVKDIVAEGALTGDTKEAQAIIEMMLAGLQVRHEHTMTRAAEMETALAVALLILTSKRIVKNDKYYSDLNVIVFYLKKWQGRSAIQWDSLIAAIDTMIAGRYVVES